MGTLTPLLLQGAKEAQTRLSHWFQTQALISKVSVTTHPLALSFRPCQFPAAPKRTNFLVWMTLALHPLYLCILTYYYFVCVCTYTRTLKYEAWDSLACGYYSVCRRRCVNVGCLPHAFSTLFSETGSLMASRTHQIRPAGQQSGPQLLSTPKTIPF